MIVNRFLTVVWVKNSEMYFRILFVYILHCKMYFCIHFTNVFLKYIFFMYFRSLQRIWRQIGAKVLTVRKENTKYGKAEINLYVYIIHLYKCVHNYTQTHFS